MTEKINKQKQIKIINDPVEAVRKLPDVYIGALGNNGFLNMYREIIQNSLDEIIKGNTIDKNIMISYDERTHMVIVEDNGQGIQLDMLKPVFSILHSSSNYDKKSGSGDYSSGKNGMGATITNFLSKMFIVESYRLDGTARKVEFIEGRCKSEKDIKCPKGKHGLITVFVPSDMMGEITVTIEELIQLTWSIVHFCKIGTKVIFNSINTLGQKNTTIIENKKGIFELIDSICERKVFEPIYYEYDDGSMKIEVLFSYNVAEMNDPIILGFANMCPTSGGTHIEGFLDALVKFFKDYMNKIFLANNNKLTVNAQDIRTGLRGVISVFSIHPMFTGQSKEIFSEASMKPFMYSNTLKALEKWSATNPNDLQRICKYLKEVCEIRTKSDTAKIKISDKYTASVISGLPAKYKKPNGKKNIEVIICEGDSACSGMENNRDKECQGIFPIKGKMPNAFIKPVKTYFENEEVAGLFKIFGYNGYSKTFDPSKFKPSKVIIAADSDADGSHIVCLVFSLFLKYLPFVIQEGKLFVANPPLYGIQTDKGKMKFFANSTEYISYVQNLFCKQNVIANESGRAYTKKELVSILKTNIDYIKLLNHVSSTYAIDQLFLEFLLYNKDLPYKKFKSTVEKAYKFVKVDTINGVITLTGLVNSRFHTIFFNNRLFTDCAGILNIINKSSKFYLINGVKSTIYQLMSLFNSFEPKNLTRYKGLGEMDPKMLGQSTIIPGYGRTLKQYTSIEDVKAELDRLTKMQSDKSVFIQNIGPIKREDIE